MLAGKYATSMKATNDGINSPPPNFDRIGINIGQAPRAPHEAVTRDGVIFRTEWQKPQGRIRLLRRISQSYYSFFEAYSLKERLEGRMISLLPWDADNYRSPPVAWHESALRLCLFARAQS
jgi:hypothetical protein